MAQMRMDSLPESYSTLCRLVLDHGRRTAPRGRPTFELPDVTLVLEDTRCVLPVDTGRHLSTSLAAVEAIQLCGGFTDVNLIKRNAPQLLDYGDEGFFWGAYGPRIRHQLPGVIEHLVNDRDTRRAVINIWETRDLYVDAVDIPCTCLLIFQIRDHKLELHTTMRSNDVWRGTPYDCFQFCALQSTVAEFLDYESGPYYHHAVSLHLYEEDADKVNDLHPANVDEIPDLGGFQSGATIGDTMNRAREVARGEAAAMTNTELWYWSHLK